MPERESLANDSNQKESHVDSSLPLVIAVIVVILLWGHIGDTLIDWLDRIGKALEAIYRLITADLPN